MDHKDHGRLQRAHVQWRSEHIVKHLEPRAGEGKVPPLLRGPLTGALFDFLGYLSGPQFFDGLLVYAFV
jgi:hypothetical protein